MRKSGAEKIKLYLARQKLMDINYRLVSSNEFIYFPIRSPSPAQRRFLERNAKIVDAEFERNSGSQNYRDALRKALGDDYDSAVKSYDVIGSIALIEDAEIKTARKIAKAIMAINRNVKTVLCKVGPVSGVYRVRKYRHVAGVKTYETVYRENGAVFSMDLRRSFISTRLAYERGRISSLVGRKENVVVMFAGAGPFAIEIAKLHRDAKIVAIELNRSAYSYMLRNIRLNKADNIEARLGDVNKVAADYAGFADRIVMPLPKSASNFLGAALKVARKGCTVHYYAFGKRESAVADSKRTIKEFFARHGKRVSFVSSRTVRTYSPSEIEIVLDFKIR